MNWSSLERTSAAGLLSAALVLFSGCQYWEDLFDDGKPPPDKPLTDTPSVLKSYTEEQADYTGKCTGDAEESPEVNPGETVNRKRLQRTVDDGIYG